MDAIQTLSNMSELSNQFFEYVDERTKEIKSKSMIDMSSFTDDQKEAAENVTLRTVIVQVGWRFLKDHGFTTEQANDVCETALATDTDSPEDGLSMLYMTDFIGAMSDKAVTFSNIVHAKMVAAKKGSDYKNECIDTIKSKYKKLSENDTYYKNACSYFDEVYAKLGGIYATNRAVLQRVNHDRFVAEKCLRKAV